LKEISFGRMLNPQPEGNRIMAANSKKNLLRIYDGEGDTLMQKENQDEADRIILVPDALPSKVPDTKPKLRIMWGQHLLEDLLNGRYRSLVCAVNATDNSRGIVAQLAALLPTSQWDEASITANARQFAAAGDRVKVLKFDMDLVEVLAILRPTKHKNLSIEDLSQAFEIVSEMVRRKPGRLPSASVSFLDARANALLDRNGHEPSFEAVLRTMYEAGYTGDVYPSPSLWKRAPTGVYARYPFSPTLDRLRDGGF
jgi:hypothetical protein